MPTRTFFHLSEEKQKRLLDAARIEFSRAALKDASISNIVKLAEIPRGSFYQYFADKEDLYFYYFLTLRKDKERDIEKQIALANGDFIEAIDVYFSQLITDILIGENASFYRHLFMSMDYHFFNRISNDLTVPNAENSPQPEHQEYTERLYHLSDLAKMNIKNQIEFKWLAQLAMHAVFSSIADGYRQLNERPDYDIQQTIQQFKKKLSWLRDGVYK